MLKQNAKVIRTVVGTVILRDGFMTFLLEHRVYLNYGRT